MTQTRYSKTKMHLLLKALAWVFVFFSCIINADAQTQLISVSDGGFENATSTYAANGWTSVVPGVARQWQVGTAAGSVAGGTKAAYVGAAANYNGANGAQVGHFYRDLVIPAGATAVTLNFQQRLQNPDDGFDYLRVFTTTTANTPVSGTSPGAGYTLRYQNTTTAYAAFTAMAAIDLTALAGSTVRLVFTNVSDGVAPAANFAVDNVTFSYTPFAGSCAPPTGLTASSVTSSGATVSWTAAVPTPGVGYEYVVSTVSTAPAGSGTATGGTSVPVSGLSANTTYYLFVRSICGGANGNSTWAGPYSFITPCASITTVPYSESFNSIGVLPTCWTTSAVTSSTTWTFAANDGDFVFTPHSGAGMAVKNYDGAASQALLVSRPINLNAQPAQQVRLNVWIYRNANGVNADRVRFLVNTAPNLTGATLLIDVRTLITSAPAVGAAGWYNYTGNIPLSFNAASNFYVIAEGTTTASLSSYSVGFDDFVIENIPACVTTPVASLNAITTTSASIAFTCASCTGTYVVEYGAPGFTPGTGSTAGVGGTVVTGASSPISIGPLTANTNYTVYVRNNCSGSNYSANSGALNITTPCNSTTVPYTQNFDGVTAPAIPACWTITDNNGDNTKWLTYAFPPAGGSSPNALTYQYNVSNAADDWAFSQGLALTAGVNYQLTFKYACISASFPERLEVKWGSSPAAGGMTGGTLFSNLNIINTTYNTVTVYFSPISSGDYYLGFHCISLADEDYLYVDDVNVAVGPACIPPSTISVGSITTNSASVSFSSLATSFIVEYGLPGFTPGTAGTAGVGGTVVTGASSPIALSGLNSGTNYSVYVRTNCTGSGNGYSANSPVINFQTLCSVTTVLPYNQGFDVVGTIPACWSTALVTGTTNWVTATDDGDFQFTPHTGAGMATKDYDGAASDALLISQPFNTSALPSVQNRVNVWIHRNDLSVNGDRVRFFVNTSPTVTGATVLIDVRALITSAPAVPTSGWYNYIANIPLSFNSANFYIIAEGNTTANINSYSVGFDDFMVEKLVCISGPTAPTNGSTACATGSNLLSWPAFGGATGYDVYFGTSTPATTLVSANQVGTTYNPGALAGGNTYYWSVVPVGPGATSCTTWSFTVTPLPVPGASSNAPVCVGSPLGLTSSNNASGQSTGNSYAWSGPSFTSTLQNPSVTASATLSHTGTYTVTVTNSFGCTASTSTVVAVNVNPTATAAVTGVSCNGLCDGGVVITPTAGQSPYIFTDGVSVNTDGIFTGTYCAGTMSVDVFDDNGCTANIPFSVTEPDVLAISSTTPVDESCAGLNNGSITVAATGGTTSYFYSKDNGSSFQSSNVFNGLTPGNYDIVVKDAHDCITGSSNVTIAPGAPLPSATISGSQNICQPGGSASLSIAFTQAGPWTYSYSDGTSTFGPFSTSGNPETVNVSPASTKTYTVTAVSNGCVGTTTGSAVVTVSTAPPTVNLAFPTVPAYACNGNSFPANTSAVTNTLVYTWDGPAGTTFDAGGNPYSSGGTSVTVNYGAPNGSGYNICVQGSNACGTTTRRCSFVRGTVNVPGVIAPANNRTTECASTSAGYSIAAVTGATGYTWSMTGNATVVGSGTSATVNFGAGWTGGTLSVTANTPCYSSAPRSLALSNATATPGAISGSATACPGSGVTYSVPATGGAATYNWVLPANTTGSSSSNSISVTFLAGFTFGDIKVSITSICGITSAQKAKTVSSGLPAVPASINGNLSGLCGQTVVYSCPSVSGASSYTWTTPGTINSGQGSTSINATFASFVSGNVCVTANNSCGSSAPRCVSLTGKPVAPTIITYSPNPICPNTAGVDLQVAPVFGTSGYVWTFPAGVTPVLDLGNEQIVNWGSTGGTVTVTVSNACGNSSKNQTISLGCREIAPQEVTVNSDVTVYPNPAHNNVTVQFNVTEKTGYVLNLMDLSGRVISTAKAIAQKGINTSEMDLSQLAKGVYIIEVKSDLLNKQMRVIVE